MRQIKIYLFISMISVFCFALPQVRAEEGVPDAKSELASDKQEIKTAKQEIVQNAGEARSEEKRLREEMVQATQSGDKSKAAQIREQLRVMHAENVQQMRQDKKGLKEAKRELRKDAKETRKNTRMQRKPDRGDNPPGPKGGKGTNWKNPPGPKGGPGASRNRR